MSISRISVILFYFNRAILFTCYVVCSSHLHAPLVIEDPDVSTWFTIIQCYVVVSSEGELLSGHDVSDGGLLTCILEMAFAGNCGIDVDISHSGKRFVPSSDIPCMSDLCDHRNGAMDVKFQNDF